MNSTFKTLGDLIENAVDVHLKTARLYGSLATRASDPRCKMLLDDMAENETNMAEKMQQLVRQTPPGTLDSYMQYTQEEQPENFIASHTPDGATVSVEEIGKLGEEMHGYQVDLMATAMRQVGSREAKELVENLCQLEKAEGRSFTRKIDSVYDM